jgi:N-acetylglutamate synthase
MLRAAHAVENIERATLAAVSPEAVHELPGWLLPFDMGTVGRAGRLLVALAGVAMERGIAQVFLQV